MPDRGLVLFPSGDVAAVQNDSGDVGIVEQVIDGGLEDAPVAVALLKTELHRAGPFLPSRDGLLHRIEILRMNVFVERASDEISRRMTEKTFHRGTLVHDGALEIDHGRDV